jgi:hypothetical protein
MFAFFCHRIYAVLKLTSFFRRSVFCTGRVRICISRAGPRRF